MIETGGDFTGTSASPRSDWAGFATWSGDGLRREAFFFGSGSAGGDLYGSVYAAESPTAIGWVICGAWGFEGSQTGRFVHRVAIATAKAGGVALVFHYPGFGDSRGELGAVTMEVLADTAVDAVREASRRHPGLRWTLAGLRLGASVAALATDRGAEAEELLLLQPVLRPGQYFDRLERASRRSLGGPVPSPGFAFGYRLPPAVLASAPAADAAVAAALSRFAGEGAIVRYETPVEIEGLPERFEQIVAPGAWRMGEMENHALVGATARWLRQRAETAA